MPFCTLLDGRVVEENEFAPLIRDGYPVSASHSLIIPKRHVGSFFEATASERTALLDLLHKARDLVGQDYTPAGYNIGINDGSAAGQTLRHMHVHLIPRNTGDNEDPRGGVRRVIPDKADYWTQR